MDIEWAKSKLEQYLALCRQVQAAVPAGEYWSDRAGALNDQAALMLSTGQRIVFQVEPANSEPLLPPGYSSSDTELRVRRVLGALQDAEEADRHLAPSAPDLSPTACTRLFGALPR